VDPYGTIYIADSRSYRLVMTDDMSGTFFTTYTGGSNPTFDSPTTIVPVPPSSPIAVPTISTTKLTYDNTVVGTQSATQNVTLTNIGSAPLDISGFTTGPDFTQTNTCGASVTAGQSCTISISFSPTTPGTLTESVAVNFANGPSKTIGVHGTGTLVTVSPLSINFGIVNTGIGGASTTVTVSNPGAAAAGISSIVLTGSRVYWLKNSCPASLASGASCTLTLHFFPQTNALYNAVITVTDAAGIAQKVSVTGTGGSN
jgi:hypothetical protein